jgi:formate hydrogenlyase subunit 3/multisubunit Na+/H+ antiporter MnhD subunit
VAYQSRVGASSPLGDIKVTPEESPVISAMLYAFAPLHKRAFGVAVGIAGAVLMALVTLAGMFMPGGREFPLDLLGQYFRGYDVSWRGVFVGAFWGFAVSFVAGWFAAFCRNLALAISAFMIRTRAELASTREFLDHI